MWILLWVVLSAILLGSTAWSLQILLRQKKAWEKFAKDRNFSFRKGTFMGPAEMNGVINDYKISFFTAQRDSADVRTRRFVTAIEIDLGQGLFDGGVVGTKEMMPFMQSLEKCHPYKVEGEGWGTEYHIFVKHDAPAQAYFTGERLEYISQLMKTRNADVLLIFNHTEVVLRLETIDPMQDPEKIDKILKRQIALFDKIRLNEDQRKDLAALTPSA